MTFATLGGIRATEVHVELPAFGLWKASVTLDSPAELAGDQELLVGGLALRGTVWAGSSFRNAARYELVGGAGGWGKPIAPLSYRNDAGVKLSTVAGDAARRAGETLSSDLADRVVGTSWCSQRGRAGESAPASEVLDLLAPRGWYVGADGITRVRSRPGGDVTAEYDVVDFDPALRFAVIATETPEAIEPGQTLTRIAGGLRIGLLEWQVSRAGLRGVAWGSAEDPFLRAFRALVRRMVPRERFLGLHEYRVVIEADGLVDLQPVRESDGLPDLRRVGCWPGAPGTTATLSLGSRVLVTFINGEPSRAFVAFYSSLEGYRPVGLAFDATDTLRLGESADHVDAGAAAAAVVREGDTVSITPGNGSGPVSGVLTITAGTAETPPAKSKVRA